MDARAKGLPGWKLNRLGKVRKVVKNPANRHYRCRRSSRAETLRNQENGVEGIEEGNWINLFRKFQSARFTAGAVWDPRTLDSFAQTMFQVDSSLFSSPLRWKGEKGVIAPGDVETDRCASRPSAGIKRQLSRRESGSTCCFIACQRAGGGSAKQRQHEI